MPVESAAFISGLVPTNPIIGDPLGQGYQHLNLIKLVLQKTFPNLSAAVTGTPAELNAAAAAFANSPEVTLPASSDGATAASIFLSPTTGGTTALNGALLTTASGGLSVSSRDSSGTVTSDFSTDGKGSLTASKALAAPILNASTAIQQGGNVLVPKGIIALWSGSATAVPAGWALCDGSNGTPDLQNVFVIGAGDTTNGVSKYAPAAQGGAQSVTLTTANLPAHNHPVTDPGHTHTLTVTDNGHVHTLDDPGHNHGLTDPGHSHTYQNQISPGAGNTQSYPGAPSTGTTSKDKTGITISPASTGMTIVSAKTGIAIAAASADTGLTVGDTGSGTAFDTLPPYYALCYIMKL